MLYLADDYLKRERFTGMIKKTLIIYIIGVTIVLAACGNKSTVEKDLTTVSSESTESSFDTMNTRISKADIHLNYSNMVDDETRNRVKTALENVGVKKDDIQNFFASVDEYNNAVGKENLAKNMTSIDEAFPKYDTDKLIDLWTANGGFVGRNCRITSYSLMNDFITVSNPIAGDTTMLFSDFEAISEKNIFEGESKKNFDSIFSYIDVSKTMDTNELAAEIQRDWTNKQISFHNDKMHMISVFMTLDDGTSQVQEFIGHTGILVPDGDKYIFIEKLAFQLPYQAVVFNSRQDVNDYLMGYYDTDADGIAAKPIIFEDDRVMPEYRVLKNKS